ncbi:MAG TPA: hypothetical protein PKA00_13385 [Saprospiraceae bacterium]|nr:hypothetical protein [Saprospiraceae bacterium]HMQ83902.1 hypothetical protein [Saprospiraceae bacterium]
MSPPTRNFGLYVYLGIEVRNFLFSGLAQELNKRGRLWMITHQNSPLLDKYLCEFNLEKIHTPLETYFQLKRHPIEAYFLASRHARLRVRGVELFNLWKESQKIRAKDRWLGSWPLYKTLQTLHRRITRKHYFRPALAQKMKAAGLTDIVLQSYFTQQNMSVAITAKALGIRVWVVNWSWKDFYINEYIPFQANGFFTWSKTLASLYRQFNRHTPEKRIHAIGNLSYDQMFDYTPAKPISHYAEKYGFAADADLFLYTMVHPNVYPKEEKVVQLLGKLMPQEAALAKAVLLVKPNPMDQEEDRFHEIAARGKIAVLESGWEYDHQANFNMITDQGQEEWLDLLHYCKATISVPSTVTVESLVFKKPAINPLYDAHNRLFAEFERLYLSSFYKNARERSDVIPCHDALACLASMKSIISGQLGFQGNIDAIIASEGQALPLFLNELDAAI